MRRSIALRRGARPRRRPACCSRGRRRACLALRRPAAVVSLVLEAVLLADGALVRRGGSRHLVLRAVAELDDIIEEAAVLFVLHLIPVASCAEVGAAEALELREGGLCARRCLGRRDALSLLGGGLCARSFGRGREVRRQIRRCSPPKRRIAGGRRRGLERPGRRSLGRGGCRCGCGSRTGSRRSIVAQRGIAQAGRAAPGSSRVASGRAGARRAERRQARRRRGGSARRGRRCWRCGTRRRCGA
jgi:hypothetical protein